MLNTGNTLSERQPVDRLHREVTTRIFARPESAFETSVDSQYMIVNIGLFVPHGHDIRGVPQLRRRHVRIVDFDANDIRIINGTTNEHLTWRVVAIICHSGTSPVAGHYWSWRRIPGTNISFVKINDDVVTNETVEYDNFDKITDVSVLILERVA